MVQKKSLISNRATVKKAIVASKSGATTGALKPNPMNAVAGRPTPLTPKPTPLTPKPTPLTPKPTPLTPKPTPLTPKPVSLVPRPS